MREQFGTKPDVPDLLHNGDVCRIPNISKRTLQHYRDTSVLPFIQIGHKCYYKREDVEVLIPYPQIAGKNPLSPLRHQPTTPRKLSEIKHLLIFFNIYCRSSSSDKLPHSLLSRFHVMGNCFFVSSMSS